MAIEKGKKDTLLVDEIFHELKAVTKFMTLSLIATNHGLPECASFFRSKALEDIEHSGEYLKMLMTITDEPVLQLSSETKSEDMAKLVANIIEVFKEMEIAAVGRIEAIQESTEYKRINSIIPKLDEFIDHHAHEIYIANQLTQQLKGSTSNVNINKVFKNITKSNK
ncbi:MAG: hypothetical protein KFW07_00810 [Mycoplasmataceae bacterium]|nr:hypothetical protein [Mycoplasmataceae bacterium]